MLQHLRVPFSRIRTQPLSFTPLGHPSAQSWGAGLDPPFSSMVFQPCFRSEIRLGALLKTASLWLKYHPRSLTIFSLLKLPVLFI